MPAKITPGERLKRIAEAAPELTGLAGAVSLCVRAEPELLRALRLTLFPRSGAWLEAEFFFSSLVGQRTPDWIVPSPEFAEELREGLSHQLREGAEERRRIEGIRLTIEQAHGGAPPEIRLEEEVNWLAVERRGGRRRAQAAIDQKLRGVFARLVRPQEEALVAARWFLAAARRMPKMARETQGFALSAFASSSVLGGRSVDPGLKATSETFEEFSRYLRADVKRRPLWTALTTRGIQFSLTPLRGHKEIEAPRTDPVVVEVRGESGRSQLVQLSDIQPVFVPLDGRDIEIRTLTRDVFRLRALGSKEQQAEGATWEDFGRIDFEYDVFLSSASTDRRWVEPFAQLLRLRLRELIGHDVRIFMDTTLSVASPWETQLRRAIENSALLIPIVSPSYLASEQCRRELDLFETAARAQTGGVVVESRSRALPVEYILVDRHELPPSLRQVAGYQFFVEEQNSGTFWEMLSDSREYQERLFTLAQDISAILRHVEVQKGQIYVWATSKSDSYHTRLGQELRQRGYRTSTNDQFLPAVKACVVLLGGGPEEFEPHRVLDAMEKRPEMRVFVWAPPEASQDLSYRDLMEVLGRHPQAEILHTSFEYFLESVLDGLKSRAYKQPRRPGNTGVSTIYVGCGPEDTEEASQLGDALKERSFIVRTAPAIGTRTSPRRVVQRERMREADRVLVYWGEARESEISALLRDAGEERKAVLLYVAPPDTPAKKEFHWLGGTIIHSGTGVLGGIEDVLRELRGEEESLAE